MNYIGKGKLIGYKSYEKDGVKKHVYSVLNGDLDSETGLFTKLECITIIEDTQVLQELKPQNVTFEVSSNTYGGQTKNTYLNIQSVE